MHSLFQPERFDINPLETDIDDDMTISNYDDDDDQVDIKVEKVSEVLKTIDNHYNDSVFVFVFCQIFNDHRSNFFIYSFMCFLLLYSKY